jgi:hypothetical protein
MKTAIQAMTPRTKMSIFWLIYGSSIVLALAPPLYLGGSGNATPILGIPFSAAYWIFDAVLAVFGVWLLWTFENIRGEIGEEPVEDGAR